MYYSTPITNPYYYFPYDNLIISSTPPDLLEGGDEENLSPLQERLLEYMRLNGWEDNIYFQLPNGEYTGYWTQALDLLSNFLGYSPYLIVIEYFYYLKYTFNYIPQKFYDIIEFVIPSETIEEEVIDYCLFQKPREADTFKLNKCYLYDDIGKLTLDCRGLDFKDYMIPLFDMVLFLYQNRGQCSCGQEGLPYNVQQFLCRNQVIYDMV